MKRAMLALSLFPLLFAHHANAAQLPPAPHFALDVAVHKLGGVPNCPNVSAQMVPSRGAFWLAELNEEDRCEIWVSRELASAYNDFPKACLVMFRMVAIMREETPVATVPRTCDAHWLFVLNHPRYLERRYG